ncbi:ArsR/SmtB family transcription factor [Celerinatantimonas yamalensis]|uniref:Metalloregulator ArsR/SmtB family transcription factor n=1 Tax=Celerinatantimonas yamalensis TaxID=559956 RepID=A0ABW9G9X6_9GAMM
MNIEQMQANARNALDLLKALANEHRLMVLCYLVEGELSVGELNQRLALSQSALSQHLAWLRNAQMVKTRKQAQTIYYSLCGNNAREVLQLLHRLYCENHV